MSSITACFSKCFPSVFTKEQPSVAESRPQSPSGVRLDAIHDTLGKIPNLGNQQSSTQLPGEVVDESISNGLPELALSMTKKAPVRVASQHQAFGKTDFKVAIFES